MRRTLIALPLLAVSVVIGVRAQQPPGPPAPPAPAVVTPPPGVAANKTITEADCTMAKVGAPIAVAQIGEPVGSVTIASAAWVAETPQAPAHCRVDGSMGPVDTAPTARPINFRVLLPAVWSVRAAQLGGGGFNGTIPNLTGNAGSVTGATPLRLGFATYGSDSGHQIGPNQSNEWALNEEVMKNLGYLQMKKTHDAAFVLIERMYGERPRFNYYFGSSQGGREALTVAQRYAADYDGIIANVPIVNFSSLMLAPELIRIQEKPLANYVPPAKVNAIRGEFMRQCDALDGIADGVMNNYMGCRAIFDTSQGAAGRHPWAAKRCPNNVDPNPADTTAGACLTDGQISTLEFVYRRYKFATPLAHDVRSFGMWVPNTDPSGSGLIVPTRFRGQEGAAESAPMHTHLGILGVTGFLMQNLTANPLDYTEGGPLNRRRELISPWLDSTDPDLGAFNRRGGKAIITIGTNDTLASPGAQLDYYQALVDKMGASTVAQFARLFVLPQTGHGLSGMSYNTDGQGRAVTPAPIPNVYDRLGLLMNWVEQKTPPPASLTVTAGTRTLPLCEYPMYPKYTAGSPDLAASYTCARQ